jgi:uncharacterized RDD family membrane protein YckC
MDGGKVQQMGFTLQQRRQAYYAVCLPLRLAMAGAVAYLATTQPYAAAALVLVFACVAAVVNMHQAAHGGKVWWSRKAHALVANVLAVDALLVLYGVVPPVTMPAIMALDVFGSFIYSLYAFH